MRNARIFVIANRWLILSLVLALLPLSAMAKDSAALNQQLVDASMCGNVSAVKCLLSKGADVNARNKDGSTALMFAANYGHLDVVRLLLDNGALVDARDADGSTALTVAAMDGRAEVAKLLVARGAKVTLIIAAMLGDMEQVQRLIEAGCDINSMQADGWTALRGAAARGHLEVVRLLLDNGAQINGKKAPSEETTSKKPLSTMSSDIAELNLDHGPMVKFGNLCNMSALQHASLTGHTEVVKLLIDRTAKLNENYRDFSAALMWASWYDRAEVVKLLKAHGAEETLGTAAMLGDKARVRELIEAGSDINAKRTCGLPALMLAAAKGQTSVVKLLLDKSAEINARLEDGSTALMWASWYGHAEVVKLLLDRGADININHVHGWTALMIAAYRGHSNVAKLLLDRGADISVKDQWGYTALRYAKERRLRGMVELLKAHGAN